MARLATHKQNRNGKAKPPISKTQKPNLAPPYKTTPNDHICPNPGSGPENLGLGQMWSLLADLEGVYVKRSHINHGFGPDVETFGVNPSQNNPKRPHLAQTQLLGRKNLGLADAVVFVGCFGARLHENTFGLNLSQNSQK